MPAQPESEMGALLAQSDTQTRVGRGDVRAGTVMEIGSQGLIVDLGLKRDGVVPQAELDKLAEEGVSFNVGQVISVTVVEPEDRDGNLLVSVHQPRQNQDWLAAEQLLATGEVWEGTVSGYNRGGLIVPFGELRAFVPASHLIDLPRGTTENERQSRLVSLVGKTLGLQVIEVNRERQRLVMSQRDAQKAQRGRRKAALLEDLAEGQVRRGVVSGLRDFGVFVNLGGVEGLIHISELSWQRVKHPREVVRVGQEVEVKIVKVDPASQRIGLSLKQLQPDPWQHVDERLRAGDWVEGRVTRLTSFGAFVDLGDGVEGLLHSSQMKGGEGITEGQTLRVRVVSVEANRQRIGLSLRTEAESHSRGPRGKGGRAGPAGHAPLPSAPWAEDEAAIDESHDDEGR